MLEGGRNGPVGRVVMSGPGGEYTMSRGVGWLTGPSSSSRSVQVGRWPDGRKKSGGSAGAAFSGREIGSRQGGSTPSSGQSGLGVEEARDKLVCGGGSGGCGRPGCMGTSEVIRKGLHMLLNCTDPMSSVCALGARVVASDGTSTASSSSSVLEGGGSTSPRGYTIICCLGLGLIVGSGTIGSPMSSAALCL